MISAVIFDMDGVIIDSEKLYRKAFDIVVTRYGGASSGELFARQMGKEMKEAQKIIVETAALEVSPECFGKEYLEEFLKIARKRLIPNPGLEELLKYLKGKVRIGLASSTPRVIVKEFMNRLGLSPYFDEIICGDMVARSKPDPEIYRLVSQKLNVKPENCIAIEDSPSGIESAVNAGIKVFALIHDENRNQDLTGADECFETLGDIEKKLKTLL